MILILILFVIAFIIYAILESCPGSKNEQIFHERKIIEVTHGDGSVDYTVKINGLLGMPFLWQIDVRNSNDFFEWEDMTGLTLEAAKRHVERKQWEYNRDRVVKKKEITYGNA